MTYDGSVPPARRSGVELQRGALDYPQGQNGPDTASGTRSLAYSLGSTRLTRRDPLTGALRQWPHESAEDERRADLETAPPEAAPPARSWSYEWHVYWTDWQDPTAPWSRFWIVRAPDRTTAKDRFARRVIAAGLGPLDYTVRRIRCARWCADSEKETAR